MIQYKPALDRESSSTGMPPGKSTSEMVSVKNDAEKSSMVEKLSVAITGNR